MNKPFKALRDKMSPESQQRAATMTRELLRDELIGFGKSASKTADWIVDTYLPGAHVGTRISLENAIAECILDRVEELEQQRDAALKLADDWEGRDVAGWLCADELRVIFVSNGEK